MKKILLFLTLFTGMTLTGCNDSFLEKYPVTSLTEENAFQSYDNFKAFMWPCYEMFSNTNIATSTTAIGRNSHYLGDVYAGYLEQRGASSQNKYAFQTVTNATSGNGWNFSSFIRRINIMLSHVDDSNMTEEEIAKARWEAEVYSKQDEAYQRFIDIREDAVRTLNEANNALAANKKVWEKDKKKNVKAQIGHLGKLISKAPIDKLNEEKAASMHEASEAVKEALR